MSHGLYGAPLISITRLGPNSQIGISPGFQIGWIMNHNFALGVQVQQLWTNIKADWTASEEPLYLNFSYSGLRVSYLHLPNDLLHLEFYALYGAGLAGYRQQEFGDFDNLQDKFQIIEPGMVIETNMTHFMRLAVAVSYHFVQIIELVDMKNVHFSGINLTISMKVGLF